MQARHKIIQIELNSRVRLTVMTYSCILIFIPLPVVCYSVLLLVRERLPELLRLSEISNQKTTF